MFFDLQSVLTNEYEKGEIAGIRLFMQLPGIAIEQITADIEKVERELGYDRAEREPCQGDAQPP